MATTDHLPDRTMALLRLDLAPPHRPPALYRVALATLVAIAISLAADAGLVAIGTAVFPSTVGYGHFQFHDYARLTIIGIVIAGAAWPMVARVCREPRWLFLRLAVLVTLVLFLPDLYIWHQGQPVKAIVTLMEMHVAIALVTYPALVYLAPVRARDAVGQRGASAST